MARFVLKTLSKRPQRARAQRCYRCASHYSSCTLQSKEGILASRLLTELPGVTERLRRTRLGSNYTFAADFFAGFGAEAVACILFVPIDVVKERLQVCPCPLASPASPHCQLQPPSPDLTVSSICCSIEPLFRV